MIATLEYSMHVSGIPKKWRLCCRSRHYYPSFSPHWSVGRFFLRTAKSSSKESNIPAEVPIWGLHLGRRCRQLWTYKCLVYGRTHTSFSKFFEPRTFWHFQVDSTNNFDHSAFALLTIWLWEGNLNCIFFWPNGASKYNYYALCRNSSSFILNMFPADTIGTALSPRAAGRGVCPLRLPTEGPLHPTATGAPPTQPHRTGAPLWWWHGRYSEWEWQSPLGPDPNPQRGLLRQA